MRKEILLTCDIKFQSPILVGYSQERGEFLGETEELIKEQQGKIKFTEEQIKYEVNKAVEYQINNRFILSNDDKINICKISLEYISKINPNSINEKLKSELKNKFSFLDGREHKQDRRKLVYVAKDIADRLYDIFSVNKGNINLKGKTNPENFKEYFDINSLLGVTRTAAGWLIEHFNYSNDRLTCDYTYGSSLPTRCPLCSIFGTCNSKARKGEANPSDMEFWFIDKTSVSLLKIHS